MWAAVTWLTIVFPLPLSRREGQPEVGPFSCRGLQLPCHKGENSKLQKHMCYFIVLRVCLLRGITL
jgi:hypothetical protein